MTAPLALLPLLPLLVLASTSACLDPTGPTGPAAPAADAPHLPADAHYIVVPRGYASPEACIANEPQPFSCLYALSLCADGRAGLRTGDIVEEGTYGLHDSVARITFEPASPTMSFDVQAVADLDDPSTTWIIDTQQRWNTLQFDTIDCTAR